MIITLCLDLQLGWVLKQTCSSLRKLSNGVSHSTCMHQGRVNSRPLVIGSQTANLTPGPSFCHNLCCECSNGQCEAIFDIYTSIAFQWYKKHPNVSVLTPTIEFWSFGSLGGLPIPNFRNVSFILTLPLSRVATLLFNEQGNFALKDNPKEKILWYKCILNKQKHVSLMFHTF
jgi:hypothetical protein